MNLNIGEGRYAASTFDDDLYKINMQAAVFQLYPKAQVRYRYINRGGTKFPRGFDRALRTILDNYKTLEAPKHGRDYLETYASYLSPAFLDYLMRYRLNPNEVGVTQNGEDLSIDIEGYWYSAIRWEIILMSTISELFFQMTGQLADIDIKRLNTADKKTVTLGSYAINHADFGTRRRLSFENHALVVKTLKNYGGKYFVGSSNVHLAMENDIKPIGTQAHEWFMFHAAKYGYRMAHEMAMEAWVKVFDGDLGIVLPDTFGTKVFLESFTMKFAKLYDGGRQDSGDYKEFTDLLVDHYKKLRIDPMTKTIVYSDGIDSLEKSIEIGTYARKKIGISSLGIGTWFTNDVGLIPLNQVIKMVEAKPVNLNRWVPTIKLSDSPGKSTGDEGEREIAKRTFGLV